MLTLDECRQLSEFYDMMAAKAVNNAVVPFSMLRNMVFSYMLKKYFRHDA